MLDEGLIPQVRLQQTQARHEAAQASLNARAAELQSAHLRWDASGSGYATGVLLAPIAGVVTARRATQGLTVQRGTDPLVELGDSRSLWVIADVFERDLPLGKAGAKTEVTVESVEGTLRGTVTAIGPVVASELRAAPVYVAIEAGGRPLRPGMFGRARIDASTTGPSLPVSAADRAAITSSPYDDQYLRGEP